MSGPAHFSRLPVPPLTFCTFFFFSPSPRPLLSRRRASIDPLAQKKAAQRRDAKLTQLLAQNDEVRDADFILLPAFKWGVRQRVGCGEEAKAGKRDGMEGCACVREVLQRRMLLMVRWWEFGWMGGGKLRVAEEGGRKLCERREREKCPVRRWLFRMACCQPLMTALK